jgi:hypothetical protein
MIPPILRKIENPDNIWCDTPGGNNTEDKIFLLSLDEADRYFGNSGDYINLNSGDNEWILSNEFDGDRQAIRFFNPKRWWLRSPGRTSNMAARVLANASVDVAGLSVDIFLGDGGIRPALWIKLTP